MKRLLFLISIAFTALSCSNDYYLEKLKDLEDRVSELEKLCSEMNNDISSMQNIVQSLQSGDYITDVQPVMENGEQVGYTIVFEKHGSITIMNGKDGEKGDQGEKGEDGDKGDQGDKGEDGFSPVVGVKKDSDGRYYWTLNGEWMLDDTGNKLPVTGADGQDGTDGEDGMDGADGEDGQDGMTPELKIEEGYWYISYDNGSSWTLLGKATGADGQDGADGKDGDSFFSDVIAGETHVTIGLKDGTSFTIPMAPKTTIAFDIDNEEAPAVAPGSTIRIGYVLSDATESTSVSASSDGYYKVSIERTGKDIGTICVNTPNPYTDGFITVHVSDGKSFAFNRTINFYEGKMTFPTGQYYPVPSKGGNVTVRLYSNFNYSAEVETSAQSWLSIVPETKAEMKPGSLVLSVSANSGTAARSGKVMVYGPDKVLYTELTVMQASNVFSISKDNFVVKPEGETVNVQLTSSLGVKASVDGSTDWVNVSVEHTAGENYILKAIVSANEGSTYRSADIQINDETGTNHLGKVTINQIPAAEDKDKAMIFEVRANYSNDFTAYLPINPNNGDVDAYVDWGDGNVEHYSKERQEEWISHRYDTPEPTTYTVKITGTVKRLSSYNIPAHTVTKIIQWGQTGLVSMQDAFTHNPYITSLPADNAYSFSNVTSFEEAFYCCTNLTAISAGLFSNCTNATSFLRTFSDCTGLTSLPEGLFNSCSNTINFLQTFSECTGLTSLPADLFKDCSNAADFSSTFSGCTGLTYLPEGLFKECSNATDFSWTFNNCTGLTTLPERLFEGCLNAADFSNTFNECTGLTSLPADLFKGCSNAADFSSTFSGCTGLTYLPEGLFEGCLKATNFSETFNNCTGLTSLPTGLFKGCSNAISFSETFNKCTGLTSLPEGLFKGCSNAADFSNTFNECTELISLPEGLFKGCSNAADFSNTFNECTGLTFLPESLFEDCSNATNFYCTFSGCTGLSAIPVGLFDNCRRVERFDCTFSGCSNVTGESPYTIIDGKKYHLYERHLNTDQFITPYRYNSCFGSCKGLTDYSSIPETWK